MNKIIKSYAPFMQAGIQTLIIYRMNFLGFVIGGLIYCFVMFYLWRAVFDSNGEGIFLGFSMTDMVIYLFLANTTSQLTYSSVSEVIGEEIKDGSISMRLLKPVNTDLSYMFSELGEVTMKLLVLFLPMITGLEIYRFCITGTVMFNAINFLLYLLSVVLAYIISFRVNLCFGFIAFYVKNLWGIGILKNSIIGFLSGSLIPLAFMPDRLRVCLEYMPFASMGYTPVMIYMGKYGANEILFRIGLQVVWALLLYGLSKLIWFGAIKKLCVQGG
ncbi:MAG: ABC-2 family transporter protein [Acutalibacteraceae bacterium]|nr:ABC-2 family transporter protein [Acutalibacteraceae bacterium]